LEQSIQIRNAPSCKKKVNQPTFSSIIIIEIYTLFVNAANNKITTRFPAKRPISNRKMHQKWPTKLYHLRQATCYQVSPPLKIVYGDAIHLNPDHYSPYIPEVYTIGLVKRTRLLIGHTLQVDDNQRPTPLACSQV
jgi:hypothetical protein